MHCVLIMPPASVLVWSSDAGKSIPVGHFLYSNLWAAPALLQGLVPVQGSALGVLKQDPGRETSLSVHSSCCFLRSVLRAQKKKLGFDADCWAVEMFLTAVAFSFFSPHLYIFCATKPFSSFCLKPL